MDLNNIIKRFLDIVISGSALIILLPIMLVISFLIKFDSKGPVFFLQERRTKNGKVFRMLKFRSMVVNAEHTGAGLFNYENDPRVTRVGRFLRDSSLDELPQLLNILLGDMAIVGPRPCVVYELGDFDTLNKRYKKRFIVKGGLTGLAQVKGRNNIAWDEKIEFDNEYVDLCSRLGILIDLKIIIETVIKVFHKENIYEVKSDQVMNDEEAAKIAEQEIIRIAHLPD